jgi:S1-C subfamily serine protease
MSDDPALHSVVALAATIPEDAFTAATLGTRREGSGVVIRDGLVLTIGYLVTEAEEVWLTTPDGRAVPAHVLGFDQETGFGLVQALRPLALPALPLGRSAAVRVGDAVSLADGMGEAIEARVVARQEFAGYWEYLLEEAIFTAPAHPFWGGAPLIGADGALLGIGSLRLEMRGDDDTLDINMVVPIDLLPPILDDLATRGRVAKPPRPWLGTYAAESDGRVVVMQVAERGPAAAAGLKRGDIIAEIGGDEVESLADLYRKVWRSGPAGTEIALRVVRDGRDSWRRVKSADRYDFLRRARLQ